MRLKILHTLRFTSGQSATERRVSQQIFSHKCSSLKNPDLASFVCPEPSASDRPGAAGSGYFGWHQLRIATAKSRQVEVMGKKLKKFFKK